MAKEYSKETLVNAYLHRFVVGGIDINDILTLEVNANKLYDGVGKIEFRKRACVDADAVREYLASL